MGLLAPGAGALPVAVVTGVTTALLWAALPVRPSLRGLVGNLDPVLAPVVLLAAALVTPFVAGEVELQNTSWDEHAHLAHYFDMAWLVLVFAVLGVAGAVLRSARGLQVWAGGGVALTGIAMLATGEGAVRGAMFVAVGAVLLGAWVLGRRGVRQIAGARPGA